MQTTNLDYLLSWTRSSIEFGDVVDYNRQRQTMLKTLVDRINGLPGVGIQSDIDDNGYSTPWKFNPRNMNGGLFERNKFLLSNNEFGHARIDAICNPSVDFDIGGHLVLPPAVYEIIVNNGWAMPHPFAGRFHAVANCHLPVTLVFFRAPLIESEMETMWAIIKASYEWIVGEYRTSSNETYSSANQSEDAVRVLQ